MTNVSVAKVVKKWKKPMPNQPRRCKRLGRSARLGAAKGWLPTYEGKNLVRGYRRRFGVDLVCAIKELGLLGIKLDASYITQALASHMVTCEQRRKRRERRCQDQQFLCEKGPDDCDDHFAFIAGYTSGGFPYGLTWEEWHRIQAEEPHHQR